MNLIRMAALLFAGLCSAQLWAAACTAVFPDSITANSANQLNLAGVPWQNSPALGNSFVRSLGAGNHYFGGGSTGNGWILNATGGPTTVVFVNGSLSLSNNSELNAGGNPQNLILVVNGSLSLANNVVINGFVYVTGSIFIGQNLVLNGAITAQGATNQPGGGSTSLTYNDAALNLADFGDLCSQTLIQVHHYELLYQGAALTCNPQPVKVRACRDASCSSLYTGPLSLTLSPSSGWTATAPATISSGRILNFSGGAAEAQLRVGTPVSVVLGLSASVPASNPLVCSTSGCTITYASSGFVLQVPNLIAAKPAGASIRAVRQSDSSQACVPGFADVTRSVAFTSAYSTPASGTLPVVVNGSSVTASATSLNLAFDSSGTAALTVSYHDAGQMSLSARYEGGATTGDAGLLMTGATLFVSKPYGLLLQTDTSADCTVADSSCPVFPGGVRAGDPFSLRIKAVAWQSDGEALTAAALADNPVTKNFQLGNIALGRVLVAPASGTVGSFSPTSYSHALGSQTAVSSTIGEVGVFRLSASPTANSYFSETVSGGESALVGRFIPAYLGASGSASLTPSCGSFSYQGQPMVFASGLEPALTVTGYNRTGSVTTNYDRPGFWRLAEPAVGAYSSVTAEVDAMDPADLPRVAAVANRDARLTNQGAASLSVTGVNSGDGLRVYRWSGETLLYTPGAVPGLADAPFQARIRQNFTAASLTDDDGACVGAGVGCSDFSYPFTAEPGSEVRLGRLRIGNAHGSELQALNLPLSIETWQALVAGGYGFRLEGLDNCSAAVLGDPVLDGFSGKLAAGETSPGRTGPTAGFGLLSLTAPGAGNEGSVRGGFAGLPAPVLPPTWLEYDWNGTGREAARGVATFGIYPGATPLIFRRELYR
ncbi:MAG: DUF6701 domain-containing protein [Pseudomonadota bacterium]